MKLGSESDEITGSTFLVHFDSTFIFVIVGVGFIMISSGGFKIISSGVL